MRARLAEAAAISGLAAAVTLALAGGVLIAPSEQVFGLAIVGRHHDPFSVMEQFSHPMTLGVHSQPVTDLAGALLARVVGPVAAYNWLVLSSFPLAAAAGYLLARHLTLSRAAASIAAMAFAFSPFHLAQAAYHPHVAQVQWVALYLLALWRCLDRGSAAAAGVLAAATIAVTLSNFYAGLIAAVITPVAVAVYWLATRRDGSKPVRRLAVTVAALLLIAAAGTAYAAYAASPVLDNRADFAFPRADLFRYSAKWWSYLLPPTGHPLVGHRVARFWTDAGVREGLLEQQVSLGWGLIGLGLVAIVAWMTQKPRPGGLKYVPVLAAIAVTALVCSLSPERSLGGFTFVRPSALLYELVPMFRAYGRFGVVVQLMAALLAGLGFDRLRQAGPRRARLAAVVLVALVAAEYAVSPATLSRDVLPTRAHRWVLEQPGRLRVLDCTPFGLEAASIPWLTQGRVTLLGSVVDDCAPASLAETLAAAGYTHVLLRRGAAMRHFMADHPALAGFQRAARFNDGEVFAVTAAAPAVYTAAMAGFFPRERDGEWAWRWMGAEGVWTVVNTTARPAVVILGVTMSAFERTRRVDVRLDGLPVQSIVVDPQRRSYDVGPLTLTPGAHAIGFHPDGTPTPGSIVAGNMDARLLSLALGTWTWHLQGDHP